jgi:hypothetical protein
MNDAALPLEKWLKYAAATLCTLISILQWQGVNQRDDSGLVATNILVFVAIGSLLWEKRRSLQVHSDWGSSLIGFGLIRFHV